MLTVILPFMLRQLLLISAHPPPLSSNKRPLTVSWPSSSYLASVFIKAVTFLATSYNSILLWCNWQVCETMPIFLQLFRQSEASTLTMKVLVMLLKPRFSETGSNKRRFENEVYEAFTKYLREAASKYWPSPVYIQVFFYIKII